MEHYKSFATLWMSKVITKLINGNVRKLFRDIEKKSIKLIEIKSHRAFNECCFNNNLLPNYTNIYIIYMTKNQLLRLIAPYHGLAEWKRKGTFIHSS